MTPPTPHLIARIALGLGLAAALALAAGCSERGGGNGNGGGSGGGAVTPPQDDPPVGGAAAAPALPSYWFESDFDAWLGRPWMEIDLLRWVEPALDQLGDGTHHVVFYRRSCDHCEEMFRDELAPNPGLAAKVIAVEVPEDKDNLRAPNAWAMPDTACDHRALPVGTNWIIQTPLAVRVENGAIACAEEGEHRTCMELVGP